MIRIHFNGLSRRTRKGSIANLVASHNLARRVAVGRNHAILPLSMPGHLSIAENDALDIVHFVGGG
jgi:thiamine biosynthesis protein ThiS